MCLGIILLSPSAILYSIVVDQALKRVGWLGDTNTNTITGEIAFNKATMTCTQPYTFVLQVSVFN